MADAKYLGLTADQLAKIASDLSAQNEKLRKQVRVYRACHDHINACRGCAELPQGCDALDMMRTLGSELGIEALFEQVY